MYNYADIQVTINYLNKQKEHYIQNNYSIPKWIQFSEFMLKRKWNVYLYKSKETSSRYLYIEKNKKKNYQVYKIRFSNHRSNAITDLLNGKCDYYIGRGGNIKFDEIKEIFKSK